MNMYVWQSDCLKHYGLEVIVVKASNVKAARSIAHAYFLEYFYKEEVESYDYDEKGLILTLLEDKDQLSYFKECYEKFVADIMKEPEDMVVLFEQGSW